jgi:C1A family cysteine protease
MAKHIYALKKDEPDLRDKLYSPTQFQDIKSLPKMVDLRPKCPPVFDQGQLGSCTANALSAFKMFLLLNGDPADPTVLSRLWLYYEERLAEGTVSDDSGAYLRDGMKVLQKLGCAPETDWAYDIAKYADTPPEQCSIDALKYKISAYHRVLNVRAMKAALAEGQTVALGIDVYESFESDKVAETGMVPIPTLGEQLLGGHAVLAVGYEPIKSIPYVIARNSWGTDWGDNGYFYLPESYFQRYVSDMWTGK